MTQSLLITGPAGSGKTLFATELLLKDARTGSDCFAFYADMESSSMDRLIEEANGSRQMPLITTCSQLSESVSLENLFEETDWDEYDTLLIDGIQESNLVDFVSAKSMQDFLLMLKNTKTNLYMTLTAKPTVEHYGSMYFSKYFDRVVSLQKFR